MPLINKTTPKKIFNKGDFCTNIANNANLIYILHTKLSTSFIPSQESVEYERIAPLLNHILNPKFKDSAHTMLKNYPHCWLVTSIMEEENEGDVKVMNLVVPEEVLQHIDSNSCVTIDLSRLDTSDC